MNKPRRFRRRSRRSSSFAAPAATLLAGILTVWCIEITAAAPTAFLPQGPVIEASSPGGTNFTVNPSRTRLDVNSSARRVVINWDSFDIGQGNEVVFTLPDGKSIAVNRVVCSAACRASSINGVLRSNGNVWILNPAGVLFGVGARVDVAGLLATSASLDDLRGFVTANTDAPIAFSMPANPGPIFVAGGAELRVRGGPAVLVGRNVTVAGSVTAADDASDAQRASTQVLYGAAGKFRLLMKESAPSAIASGDLDLFDFIIDEGFAAASPGDSSGPAIDIVSGSVTRAGQVLIRAKSAAAAAAGSAERCTDCIVVKSSLHATAGDRDGPLAEALSIRGEGVDLLLQRGGRLDAAGAAVLDPLVSMNSRGSLLFEARNIYIPQLQALRTSTATTVAVPDHVTVEFDAFAGALLRADESILLVSPRLGGAKLAAKTDVLIDAASADPRAGAITAGGSVFFAETRDAAGAARTPTANFTVGDITAGGDVLVSYRKGFTAGRLTSAGLIDIVADESLRLAAVTGAEVSLRAVGGPIDIGTSSNADFIGGALQATAGPVSLLARDGVRAGAVSATAGISIRSTGAAVGVGQLVGTTLNLSAGGGDLVFAGGSATSLRAAATGNLTVSGDFDSVGNAAFIAGGTFANTGAIRVSNGTALANASPVNGYGGIDIRAVDVQIGAPLSVRGDGVGIQFQASGAGGVVLGDGQSAPAASLQLSDAELQRLTAERVALRAATSASAGSDILVGDLALDRSKIGQLTLATGATGRVLVRGKLRGTGAPGLTIGEASLKPGGIEISGALGAADASLGALQLRSAGNILIGSSAFIEQVKSATDLLAFDVDVISPTFGGTTSGQLFIVSGPTSFEATRAILQQNTGGRLGDGIRVGVPSGDGTALIVSSATGSPARVALFGSIVGVAGNAANGASGAATSGVLAGGTAPNSLWRINTCIAGSGAACTAKSDVVTTIVATTPTVTQPPPPPAAPPAAPATPATSSTPAPSSSGGDNSGGDNTGGKDQGGGSAGGDDPGADGGRGGSAEQDARDEPDAGDTAVAEVASASTQSTANDLKPIEVDPGSLDLLNPATARELREAGVGSANEDLWPARTP